MGADIVIAVDIYCRSHRSDGLDALTVTRRVMQTETCLIADPEMAEADVLIAPAISVIRITAKQEQKDAIQAGFDAARADVPSIVAKLGGVGGESGLHD